MPSALRAIGLSAPVRLAAAVPDLTLCDPMRNADAVIRAILHAETLRADYLALPELCLTGATAGALLRHPLILQEALAALKKVAEATARCNVTASIGLPYLVGGQVMSCTALVRGSMPSSPQPHAKTRMAFCRKPSAVSGSASRLPPCRALQWHSATSCLSRRRTCGKGMS